MYYEYRGIIYKSYDTRMVFYPDYNYATHGYGKQVDYYDRGPYRYQYYTFYWSVDRGIITLTYPHDPDLNTTIYDYRMTPDYFSGYFGDSNEKFRLYKMTDYYNWGAYNGDWGYEYYSGNGPYYSKTTSSNADTTSTVTPIYESEITRGYRYNLK